ncbi:MAG: right-handed parallel beta-helix repeat-containing protein, partial [Cyanobacteria bacterium J06559_3]
IRNSYFSENGDAGLVIAGPSSAQVKGNRFENTGTGISVAPEATPEIADNHISYNTDGLVIHADAQPVLENNQILRNRRNSILEYAPWSDALTASAPPAAQPPPPSMTTATAITPGATPQPLAIGGLAPTDDPPASASEPASGQTFATAIGGIATGSEQPIPEPLTGPVPETVTPNPLFADPVAPAPPSATPEVPSPELTESSQAADAIAADNIQAASTTEPLAYPPPPTAAASPTLPESLPVEAEAVAESPGTDDSLATEATSAPAIAIAVPDSPSSNTETLPSPPEAASTTDSLDTPSLDTANPSATPTPVAVSDDSIPDAERRPPTAENPITANLAVEAPEEVDDSIPDAERRPPTVGETITDNLAVEAPNEVVAFSGPPPAALTSFGQGISTELEAMAPALKAVDIAIVPAIATTALFSSVDLTPTLEVPEAISVSLAEASAAEADVADVNDTETTDELAADADEDAIATLNPASIRPPTERRVSLTEPTIEIDRDLSLPSDSENLTEPLIETDPDQSLSSDSVDGPEAIDLTIIPPPAEDIVLPTVVSHSALADRAAAPLSEETSPATGDLPALPSDDNSSAADGARLAVPSAEIPVGSGGDLPELFATGAAPEGPPPPPSRAAALGLAYRVLIEDTDPALQDQIRQHVPDAFRVKMNGREFIQAGAYPTFDEAQAQAERLNQQGIQAQIERIF